MHPQKIKVEMAVWRMLLYPLVQTNTVHFSCDTSLKRGQREVDRNFMSCNFRPKRWNIFILFANRLRLQTDHRLIAWPPHQSQIQFPVTQYMFLRSVVFIQLIGKKELQSPSALCISVARSCSDAVAVQRYWITTFNGGTWGDFNS